MLGIWTLVDPQSRDAFCQLHARVSGEELDPNRVRMYRSELSPYKAYDLIRLEVDPHVLSRRSGRQSINTRVLSYALLRKPTENDGFAIVPIGRNSAHVYAINKLLNLSVDDSNYLEYLTFFGHVIWSPAFYFIFNLSQIDTLCLGLPPEKRELVRTAIHTVFVCSPSGALLIKPEIQTLPVGGKSYEFQIPCFHDGTLYIATCRVSADGICDMIDDRPLQIQEVFDEEPNYQYYLLDAATALTNDLDQAIKRLHRSQVLTVTTLTVDSLLQVWLLPFFAFQLLTLFFFGRTGNEVFNYFSKIQESTSLTFVCLVFGFLGTTVAIFRYIFLEVILYLRKFVPSFWTHIADSMESAMKEYKAKVGTIQFVLYYLVENFLKTLMSLSLLLYGLSNFVPAVLPPLNFGQSILIILERIPFLGRLMVLIFEGTDFFQVPISENASSLLDATVTLLFSTILLGISFRLFKLATKKS